MVLFRLAQKVSHSSFWLASSCSSLQSRYLFPLFSYIFCVYLVKNFRHGKEGYFGYICMGPLFQASCRFLRLFWLTNLNKQGVHISSKHSAIVQFSTCCFCVHSSRLLEIYDVFLSSPFWVLNSCKRWLVVIIASLPLLEFVSANNCNVCLLALFSVSVHIGMCCFHTISLFGLRTPLQEMISWWHTIFAIGD